MLSSSCTAQKNKVTQKQKSPQWKIIKKSEVDLIKKYDHESETTIEKYMI